MNENMVVFVFLDCTLSLQRLVRIVSTAKVRRVRKETGGGENRKRGL